MDALTRHTEARSGASSLMMAARAGPPSSAERRAASMAPREASEPGLQKESLPMEVPKSRRAARSAGTRCGSWRSELSWGSISLIGYEMHASSCISGAKEVAARRGRSPSG